MEITLEQIGKLGEAMQDALDDAIGVDAVGYELKDTPSDKRKKYFFAAYTFYKAMCEYKEESTQDGPSAGERFHRESFWESYSNE